MKARHEFHDNGEYKEYLRTYFAAMAMQGILSAGKILGEDCVVEYAIQCADELLKQLEQTKPCGQE